MICMRTKCSAKAECAIALNVPATGCPLPEHTPLKIVIGLQLCRACARNEKAADYLQADTRLKKIFEIQAHGLAAPDFQRAFITIVEFDSPEWTALTKHKTSPDQ